MVSDIFVQCFMSCQFLARLEKLMQFLTQYNFKKGFDHKLKVIGYYKNVGINLDNTS